MRRSGEQPLSAAPSHIRRFAFKPATACLQARRSRTKGRLSRIDRCFAIPLLLCES